MQSYESGTCKDSGALDMKWKAIGSTCQWCYWLLTGFHEEGNKLKKPVEARKYIFSLRYQKQYLYEQFGCRFWPTELLDSKQVG